MMTRPCYVPSLSPQAALNMMTRTCALELRASSAILMNSVDTGWINDENPLEKAAAAAERNHFQVRIGEALALAVALALALAQTLTLTLALTP